jgi:glucokinase
MGQYAIGLDLGGTNLRAAAIDSSGKLLHKVSGKTRLSEGRETVVEDMVSAIGELRDTCGRGDLAGIGVGVPGFIVMETGVVADAPNLPGFKDFAIRDELEKRLGARVILENDANAAALGEKWMGAGRGVNDLVLLTLGTGVGGGIISSGRVLHGFVGMAGELGHMTIIPDGNPCGCGNRGCLEKHASATAISATAKLLGLGDTLTAEDVYRLAESGNERALRIFLLVGEALGIAIANLVMVFNYPLYLIGGGVVAGWDLFAPPMIAECRKRSFIFQKTETRIEKAALGGEAGLYGTAYLPFLESGK